MAAATEARQAMPPSQDMDPERLSDSPRASESARAVLNPGPPPPKPAAASPSPSRGQTPAMTWHHLGAGGREDAGGRPLFDVQVL